MRMKFEDVFHTNANGSVSPKQPVKFGGISMNPGVMFTRGVVFNGIDIASYIGRDLEAEIVNNTIVISTFY